MKMRVFAGFATVLIGPAVPANAQRSDDAIRFLDAAIEAHQPAGAKLKARLVYTGTGIVPTQSMKPFGPYEIYPTTRKFAVDEAEQTSFVQDTESIAGVDFLARGVTTPTDGYAYDVFGQRYSLAKAPPVAYTTLLPHVRLKTIRDTATRLQLTPGAKPRIEYAQLSGASGALTFDPATNLLATIEPAPSDGVFGRNTIVVSYGGYRRIGGTAVPEAYTANNDTAVLDPQIFDTKLASVEEGGPTPAELARPAGATLTDYGWRKPEFTVETLAPGVHLIHKFTGSTGQTSFNIMAVEFADHFLVTDAPGSTALSEKVIAKLAELAPGKPVRHLVVSHHHGDHLGGLDPYVAKGVNILTTKDTAALLTRIAKVRGAAFGAPKLQTVTGRRVLRDGKNEVHLYQMGTTPHSNDMLVVHLPRQKIVYQVDFLNDGEYARNRSSDAFLKWLRDKKLKVDRITSAHGQTAKADGSQL